MVCKSDADCIESCANQLHFLVLQKIIAGQLQIQINSYANDMHFISNPLQTMCRLYADPAHRRRRVVALGGGRGEVRRKQFHCGCADPMQIVYEFLTMPVQILLQLTCKSFANGIESDTNPFQIQWNPHAKCMHGMQIKCTWYANQIRIMCEFHANVMQIVWKACTHGRVGRRGGEGNVEVGTQANPLYFRGRPCTNPMQITASPMRMASNRYQIRHESNRNPIEPMQFICQSNAILLQIQCNYFCKLCKFEAI